MYNVVQKFDRSAQFYALDDTSSKSTASELDDSSVLLSQAISTEPVFKSLYHLLTELTETEDNYLQSLQDLEQGYLATLRADDEVASNTIIDVIFSGIPELRIFHEKLAVHFSRNNRNLVELSRLFLDNATQFESIYVNFCSKYCRSNRVLEEMKFGQTSFWSKLLKCQSNLGHKLPLATYLLKPVQRVLKYQLILQECLKHCTSATETLFNELPSTLTNDENFSNVLPVIHKNKQLVQSLIDVTPKIKQALERMIQVGNHINERVRSHELVDQIRSGCADVDNFGALVCYGHFRIPGKKDTRLVLLFHGAILLCKASPSVPSSNGFQSAYTTTAADNSGVRTGADLAGIGPLGPSIEVQHNIKCKNLMLIECIPKNPLAFHILPFDNPKAQRTLQAPDVVVKNNWCREIKRLILETYDAAIPEKAKQIVLNITELSGKVLPETTHKLSNNMGANGDPGSVLDLLSPRPIPPDCKQMNYPGDQRHNNGIERLECSHKTAITTMQNATSLVPKTTTIENDAEKFDPISESRLTMRNELVLEHLSTSEIQNGYEPSTINSLSSDSNNKSGDECDFRCIAVDINEELLINHVTEQLTSTNSSPAFSPDSVAPIATPTLRTRTVFESGCRKAQDPPPPPIRPYGRRSHMDQDRVRTRMNRDRASASVYIDCPNAASFDLATSGRAYEQYIEKARAKTNLSPNDLDDIVNPLRQLVVSSDVTSYHCTAQPSFTSIPPPSPPQSNSLSELSMFRRYATTDSKKKCGRLFHDTDEIGLEGIKNGYDSCSSNSSSSASSPSHVFSRVAIQRNKCSREPDVHTKEHGTPNTCETPGEISQLDENFQLELRSALKLVKSRHIQMKQGTDKSLEQVKLQAVGPKRPERSMSATGELSNRQLRKYVPAPSSPRFTQHVCKEDRTLSLPFRGPTQSCTRSDMDACCVENKNKTSYRFTRPTDRFLHNSSIIASSLGSSSMTRKKARAPPPPPFVPLGSLDPIAPGNLEGGYSSDLPTSSPSSHSYEKVRGDNGKSDKRLLVDGENQPLKQPAKPPRRPVNGSVRAPVNGIKSTDSTTARTDWLKKRPVLESFDRPKQGTVRTMISKFQE